METESSLTAMSGHLAQVVAGGDSRFEGTERCPKCWHRAFSTPVAGVILVLRELKVFAAQLALHHDPLL